MAITFPSSPTTNQTHTVNGRTWIYDGEKWILSITTENTFATIRDTLIRFYMEVF